MTCTCFSVDPVTFEVRFGECTDPNYFRPDPGCPVHGCPLTPDKEA